MNSLTFQIILSGISAMIGAITSTILAKIWDKKLDHLSKYSFVRTIFITIITIFLFLITLSLLIYLAILIS